MRRLVFAALASTMLCSNVSGQRAARLSEIATWGSADDPHTTLTQVFGATLTAEGHLALFQWATPEVWVFTVDGQLVRRIGRQGEGPGEFMQPSHGGLIGDSLWVGDGRLGRITVFDSDLRPARTVSRSVVLPDGRFVGPGWLVSDGRAIGMPRTRAERLAVSDEDLFDPILSFGSGGVLDTLAWVRRSRKIIVLDVEGTYVSVVNPVSWSSDVAFSLDGHGIVVVDQWPGEDEDEGSVVTTIVSPAGDTLFSRQITLPTEEIDSDWIRAEADSRFPPDVPSNYPNGRTAREFREEFIKILSRENVAPPVRDIQVGSDDTVWLNRAESDGGSVWTVLGPDLRPIGDVRFEPGERMLLGSRETVWVVFTDELDIPYVRWYQLAW